MCSEITADVKTIIESSVRSIPARRHLFDLIRTMSFNERRDAAKAIVAVHLFNESRHTAH